MGRIGGWHMWNQMKRQITTRNISTSTRNFTSTWISRNCFWCWGLSDFSIDSICLSLVDLILSLEWMICYQSWIPLTHESILVFQPTPRRARLHRHGDVDAGCDWRPYKPGYFIMIHHLSNKQRFHQSNVGCKQLEETFISSTLNSVPPLPAASWTWRFLQNVLDNKHHRQVRYHSPSNFMGT